MLNKFSPNQSRWKLAGIPNRYFSVDSSVLNPVDFIYSLDNIQYNLSRSVQLEALKLLTNPSSLKEESVIGFGGTPTDDKAMAAACYLAKIAVANSINTKIINVAKVENNWYDEDLKLVIFYNIAFNSTPTILEATRNLIRKYDKICRIVVVGGINPIDFFHYNLSTYLDLGILFNGYYLKQTKVTI